MIELSLGEVADIVGGTLHHADPATVVTGSVEFDSRKVTPGGLFVALPGERVDGHDYTSTAEAAGAVASIVTRAVDGPSIEVADGFAALAALATEVLRRLPDLTVVGVTGSAGKTSTKDLLANLLGALGPTVAPPESFNNELGHPYTVLRADRGTRFLVLENSARGIGHIRYLTEIAPPRIGAVLNVGSAHLGEFGSREAIAQAKGELVEALPPARDGGVAVLNADDPLVRAMAGRTSARVVLVGEDPSADVRAERVDVDDRGGATFTLVVGEETAEVALRLIGRHHVGNALAAAAIALECGMALADVAAALGDARPMSAHRMAPTERADGVLVIDDAYNANPESVRAALVAVAGLAAHRAGRVVAVLGPMAELGPDAPAAHEGVGRTAAELGVARIVAIGDEARAIQHGAALQGSWGGEASWVPDIAAATDLLRAELRAGDTVLVKASRSAALERLVEALLADDDPDRSETGSDTGTGTDEGGDAR